jgi:hypothetical protein
MHQKSAHDMNSIKGTHSHVDDDHRRALHDIGVAGIMKSDSKDKARYLSPARRLGIGLGHWHRMPGLPIEHDGCFHAQHYGMAIEVL